MKLRDGLRDWRGYKSLSEDIASGYDALYFKTYDSRWRDKAYKIRKCGSFLEFRECPSDASHPKFLSRADFCRQRLCRMCQWRKSLFVYSQVLRIVHAAVAEFPKNVILVLTLTSRNVSAADFVSGIDRYMNGWDRLRRQKRFSGAFLGWFRSLEITYNPKADTYHPHIHALLEVSPTYWERSYIKSEEFKQMWASAMGITDYLPRIRIERVRKRKKGVKTVSDDLAADNPEDVIRAVGEVAKYSVKVDRSEKMPHVIETLDFGLANRRLTAFGGHFLKLYKDLKEGDVEEADLVHIEDGQCDNPKCAVCNSELVQIMYLWNRDISDYTEKE